MPDALTRLTSLASAASAPTTTAGVARQLLLFLGGLLSAQGILDASLVEPIVGGILALGAAAAGHASRRRALAMEPPR